MTLPDPETCRRLARDVAPRWIWFGGMLATSGGESARVTAVGSGVIMFDRYLPVGILPDLRDPLTAAGALLVARAAWADPDLYCCNLDGYDGCGWTCIIDRPDHPNARHGVLWISAPTELEALIAAILAAPEKP